MKIDQATFDRRFQELCAAMVQLAFELVDRDKKNVDSVYVFGTMGVRGYYYNCCYQINGKLMTIEDIDEDPALQYDVSDERAETMTELGIEDLKKTDALFEAAGKEAPTLMKMLYHPKTGAFNNDLDYELILSDRKKSINTFFNQWFAELGKSSA